MPAHTRADEVGMRRLSNGALLTTADRCGNAEADRLAKAAAMAHRVPPAARGQVASALLLSRQLALWIGQITAIAGAFVTPDGAVLLDSAPCARRPLRRDSAAPRPRPPPHLLCAGPNELVLRVLSMERGGALRIASTPPTLWLGADDAAPTGSSGAWAWPDLAAATSLLEAPYPDGSFGLRPRGSLPSAPACTL